jgi:hypothetical protein
VNQSEIEKKFADPLFRVEESGWYHIVTKEVINGKHVARWRKFEPFEHQRLLNRRVIRDGWRRILVPKARRMGFSTDINMLQFDACLNNPNYHSKIVDQSQADATDKLVNRIQRAWQHMDDNYDMRGLKCVGKNQSEIKWSNGSMFTADTSGRGGSAVQFLHVSELGPIDFEDPKRADEIIDGAFPAADGGIIVVESTAKGPVGHFKRLCDAAMEINEEERTEEDFRVMFFAWHDDPRHSMEGRFSRVSQKTHDYCDYVQNEIGRDITDAQRLWYHVTSERVGNVKYEYPSLLSECWEQPVDGAIYADLVNKAREDGRVGKFPYERMLPVYTIWDLGGPDNTRCVFFQLIHGEIRIIDAQMGGYHDTWNIDGPKTPADWVELLSEKPYLYAKHILPHDGNIRQYSGNSFQGDLQKAGLRDVVRLQVRKNAENDRISETSMSFDRFVWNIESENVQIMMKHVEVYHRKRETDGISVKEKPHHDYSSHYCDAFGSIIEATQKGLCSGVGAGGTRKRRRKPQIKAYSAYA